MPEKRSEESPFSCFLSLSSYLLQHAYRSPRVAQYGELALFCLRILVEDPVLCKQMCSDEYKRPVRLCRQRPPHLPLVKGDRILVTVIFDMMVDTINHNLRRALDVNLYRYVCQTSFSHVQKSAINVLHQQRYIHYFPSPHLRLVQQNPPYLPLARTMARPPHSNPLPNHLRIRSLLTFTYQRPYQRRHRPNHLLHLRRRQLPSRSSVLRRSILQSSRGRASP